MTEARGAGWPSSHPVVWMRRLTDASSQSPKWYRFVNQNTFLLIQATVIWSFFASKTRKLQDVFILTYMLLSVFQLKVCSSMRIHRPFRDVKTLVLQTLVGLKI